MAMKEPLNRSFKMKPIDYFEGEEVSEDALLAMKIIKDYSLGSWKNLVLDTLTNPPVNAHLLSRQCLTWTCLGHIMSMDNLVGFSSYAGFYAYVNQQLDEGTLNWLAIRELIKTENIIDLSDAIDVLDSTLDPDPYIQTQGLLDCLLISRERILAGYSQDPVTPLLQKWQTVVGSNVSMD